MRPPTIRSKDLRKFIIMPIRAIRDPEINRTAALSVLAALCSYCDEAGRTYVSQGRLASDLGISRPAVWRQLRRLKELGYVVYARKQYKDQKTNTLKVIFDDVDSEDEALANLSAKERMELAEREAELKLSTDLSTGKTKQDKTHETSGVSHEQTHETSEVSSHETSEVTQNRPITDIDIGIEENARKLCVMFLRAAEMYGTPRQVNERDSEMMQRWVREGLTAKTWAKILENHIEYCRSKHRDMARGLGFFQEPVRRSLGKSDNQRVNNVLKAVAKSTKTGWK